jgi:nucleotide-binding universal stress UspA family protein
MFKHILLPTDGSKLSDKAVKQAIKTAKALGAKITAIHVTPDYARYVRERYQVSAALAAPVKNKYQEEAATLSKEILDQVCAAATAAGVECARVSVTCDSPYEAIIEQATKSGCDLIMMASHGRKGLQSMLLGSETHKVLVHSKIPALVCR